MRYRRLYVGKTLRDDEEYELGYRKGAWGGPEDGFDCEEHPGWIASFCAEQFEAVTGIKLKPGEVRKVRIHVELLD